MAVRGLREEERGAKVIEEEEIEEIDKERGMVRESGGRVSCRETYHIGV